MKINKIIVTNFRGKNYDFAPEKVNLFLAENGTGKTTLCDAIRYGLTGESPADNPVDMNVRLEFDTVTIERGKKADGTTVCKVNDSKVTVAALNQTIEDELMAAPENIRITSSTEALTGMKPEKFSEFIIKQIPEKLTFDMVTGWFGAADDKIIKTCKALLPDEEFSVDAIDAAYAKAYEKRKECKAELQEASGAYNQNTAKQPEMTPEQLEEAEKKLISEYAAQAEAMKLKAQYEEAKKKAAEQKGQLEELLKKAESLKCDQKPTDAMKERIREYMESHRNTDKILREQLTSLNKDIEQYTRILENLDKPVCPIHSSIRCTTDKTSVRGDVAKRLEEKKAEAETAKKRLAVEKQHLEKADRNVAGYEALVKKHAEWTAVLGQVETLKKNMITVPEEPKTASAMTEEQYRAKKSALDKVKADIQLWEQKLTLHKKIKSLQEQVRILDAIVKAFAPKGNVKMEIVKYYFDILEGECDAMAALFGDGYKVKLSADDGVKIMVQTPHNDEMYPTEALSGGEKATAMFIVMATLNQLSNSGIMFFDNCEILDHETLIKLKDMAQDTDFRSTFDHLFICGVNHKEIEDVFEYMDAARIQVKDE